MSYLNFNIEKKFSGAVIGIDEVGRGPLAGPVVSCACIFFDYSIEQSQLFLFDASDLFFIVSFFESSIKNNWDCSID